MEWRADEQAGWLTSPRCTRDHRPVERHEDFMLLTSADVYQSNKYGYAIGKHPKPVSGTDTRSAAAAILRTVARWETPFSPADLQDPLIEDGGRLSFD